MSDSLLSTNSVIRPLMALAGSDAPGVLAVIVGVEGPSYRPLGAMMAITGDARRVGTLSSGCVESDIALVAGQALADCQPARARYGRGSPAMDIRLPCGGGLDIMLVPNPDKAVLAEAIERYAARRPFSLRLSEGGALSVDDMGPTGFDGTDFVVGVEPELQFHIFGKGPEASTFAALVGSAGYPATVLSPDDETLAAAASAGANTRHLTRAQFPVGLAVDDRTAIMLFFHDHEWEPPILSGAVDTAAFYVGAQGSKKARATRDAELLALGLTSGQIARIRGPVGLIASAKDARTLAVSVLAEVLDADRHRAAQGLSGTG